ncbi:unnamed protein product [Arabidopsis thaliana]|uniref:(thale cress) hypothetical protein n=1 Tax=Arabidopsis thaliana TaxID=3702 RepID=A0A7G2E803_ARATH|nr:unnamed protein product [Arabidopsis thaliana]
MRPWGTIYSREIIDCKLPRNSASRHWGTTDILIVTMLHSDLLCLGLE